MCGFPNIASHLLHFDLVSGLLSPCAPSLLVQADPDNLPHHHYVDDGMWLMRGSESSWLSVVILILVVVTMQEGTQASVSPRSMVAPFNASPAAFDGKPSHLCVLAHGYVSTCLRRRTLAL